MHSINILSVKISNLLKNFIKRLNYRKKVLIKISQSFFIAKLQAVMRFMKLIKINKKPKIMNLFLIISLISLFAFHVNKLFVYNVFLPYIQQ